MAPITSLWPLVAITATLVAGLITVRRRRPGWQLSSATQFGLGGFGVLIVVADKLHSAIVAIIAFAAGFLLIALAVTAQVRAERAAADE